MTKIRTKRGGGLVEVMADGSEKPLKRKKQKLAGAPHVMNDAAPFISPIDRTEVSGRAALREHEKVHGVTQIGNDWNGKKPEYVERRQQEKGSGFR